MANDPAKTQGQTSAVATVQPQALALSVLDGYPEDRFNRLIPTAYVQQINPYLKPVVAAVQLTALDVYHLPDMPAGEDALAKTGLRKLATVAGVSVVDQYRSDDRSNPDVVEYTTKVAMSLPSGQTITAIGSKTEDAKRQRFSSDRHRDRWLKDAPAMAATKSELRALRSLLALQTTYSKRDLAKPWAVVHYVPDMENPDVQQAMLAGMAGTAARVYGRGGEDARMKVIEAPQAPDDDEPAGNAGTVTTPDGTRIDAGSGEPEGGWFGGSPPPPVPLADRLATRAAIAGQGTGPATDDQKVALQSVLGPLGLDYATDVITAVFGVPALNAISEAHAASILIAANEPGFEDDWRALADRLRAARQ